MPTLTKPTAEQKYRQSFAKIEPPERKMPTLPLVISDQTLDKLGNLQIRYAAWREYAEDLHAEALGEFMRAKEEYDYQYNRIYLMAQKQQVTDKKVETEADPILVPFAKKFTETEMYLKMVAGKLESFSNSLAVISRELTRRGIV